MPPFNQDDRLWELSSAYVRAYVNWKYIFTTVTLPSAQERLAWKELEKARKRYNLAAGRRRNSYSK